MRTVLLALTLTACSTTGSLTTAPDVLPYPDMAQRIALSLQPEEGEQVVIRFDPDQLPGFPEVLDKELTERGAQVRLLAYGPVEGFLRLLEQTDIYIWLPTDDPEPHSPDDAEALGRWLDERRGRQIHFHWGGGTMGTDGIAGEHSRAYDGVYADALDIDYVKLDRQQDSAIGLLRSGPVRVTTPAGTDLSFRVTGPDLPHPPRPFNKQNGDASRARMSSARTRIDREIELPAGVVRVAPIEETVSGTLVVPWARFGDVEVRGLRLELEGGRVASLSARQGEEAVRAAFEATPALEHFRELGIGFNPKLTVPIGSRWLPYYGYGSGVVRLSLGNNIEVGGSVGGIGTRWFFFPDATVEVGGTALVIGGELVAPPSSLEPAVMDALRDLRPRVATLQTRNRERGVPDAKGRVSWVYGDIIAIQLSPESPGLDQTEAAFAVYRGEQYKGDAIVAAIRDRTMFCLMQMTVGDNRVSAGDSAAVFVRDN